jgi:hypothetical protein
MYAESHGHFVVTPVTGDEAIEQLVNGLVGLLVMRLHLPAKAARLAKAGLR